MDACGCADGGWQMADGRWQMADGGWRLAAAPMADGTSRMAETWMGGESAKLPSAIRHPPSTISARPIRLRMWMMNAMAQNDRITDVVSREQSRLLQFIRRRVPDLRDAEDVLQDVFYKLVEANRFLMPIDHLTGWLFRVARNRITDLFRKRSIELDDDDVLDLEALLPSSDAGPEASYVRGLLLEELRAAFDELPKEQRDVFVAHELEGRSFKEIAVETGVGVNTLLSRKRYAVLHLRKRLQHIYDEITNE